MVSLLRISLALYSGQGWSVILTLHTVFNSGGTTQLFTTTFTVDITTVQYAQMHNTGRFTIQNFGGTNIKINSWKCESSENKNADYVAVGDSNMYGCFATSNANRFVEQAMTSKSKSFVIQAGIADQVREGLMRVNETIALSPSRVFISLLRNDIAAGRVQQLIKLIII